MPPRRIREQARTDGLIREADLARPLRNLVRPRVENPIGRVTVTRAGDVEMRWEPLRIQYVTYDKAANRLDIVVNGGRVALSTGGYDVPDATVHVASPTTSTTYWLYVDSNGDWTVDTVQPGGGNIEVGTITTPSAWPAAATLKGFVATHEDLLGITNAAAGDCWVVLSGRTTLRWDGSGWQGFLTVADKRAWFGSRVTMSGLPWPTITGAASLLMDTLLLAGSSAMPSMTPPYTATVSTAAAYSLYEANINQSGVIVNADYTTFSSATGAAVVDVIDPILITQAESLPGTYTLETITTAAATALTEG